MPFDLALNESPIINNVSINGRLNLVDPVDHMTQFKMHEKITIKNSATNYYDALTGDLEQNVLADTFFSRENVQILQNGIRAGVHKLSQGKFIVPLQNIDNLKIIMRSIYFQYAEHYPKNIREQVEMLNQHVFKYSIPYVYNEAVAYLKYLNDQSRLVEPLNLPDKNERNHKSLEVSFDHLRGYDMPNL
jgi:hypothetical protein